MKKASQRNREGSKLPILNFEIETSLHREGFYNIAGLDEAGRGCLAGPVVAAAVIMPSGFQLSDGHLRKVNDSKLLKPEIRAILAREIHKNALAVGVGIVEAEVIDDIGIVNATKKAMIEAVVKLNPKPDYLLIDYLTIPELFIQQKGIVRGDRCCFSIAAASIIAKVTRDNLMISLADKYPQYHFDRHKGYATATHYKSLAEFGACELHRRSFEPVRQVLLQKFEK